MGWSLPRWTEADGDPQAGPDCDGSPGFAVKPILRPGYLGIVSLAIAYWYSCVENGETAKAAVLVTGLDRLYRSKSAAAARTIYGTTVGNAADLVAAP